MQGAVLVLDLGSSRLRCAVVPTEAGEPFEAASAPYPTASARAGDLAREFNPQALRGRLLRVLRRARERPGRAAFGPSR